MDPEGHQAAAQWGCFEMFNAGYRGDSGWNSNPSRDKYRQFRLGRPAKFVRYRRVDFSPEIPPVDVAGGKHNNGRK